MLIILSVLEGELHNLPSNDLTYIDGANSAGGVINFLLCRLGDSTTHPSFSSYAQMVRSSNCLVVVAG